MVPSGKGFMKQPLTASVVLCTCQGERFLPEQLASLRAQTRPPLEVLAQDDASEDTTIAILEGAQGLPLRVKRNPTRLGFSANFASALAQARGDILFLCDQDDLWEPEKLEVLLRHFEKDAELLVACSEATRIDENGSTLPGLVLESNSLGTEEREIWAMGGAFSPLVRKNPVPGMTMALRASFREQILPIPPGWEHDYWILLMAAGLGRKILVENRPLVRYRQHGAQVIGGAKSVGQRWARAGTQSLALRIAESERWGSLKERLETWGGSPAVLALAAQKQAHLARRGGYSRNKLVQVAQIGAELATGAYHRLDAGFSTALKDLLSKA